MGSQERDDLDQELKHIETKKKTPDFSDSQWLNPDLRIGWILTNEQKCPTPMDFKGRRPPFLNSL